MTIKHNFAMALRFSANQFDYSYKPKALSNWGLPKSYPTRPRQGKGCTQVIANDRGHLLNRSIYKLPDKINNRHSGGQYDRLFKENKWSTFPENANLLNPSKSEILGIAETGLSCVTKFRADDDDVSKFQPSQHKYLNSCGKKNSLDLEYKPGDLASFRSQQLTNQFPSENYYNQDNNIETDLILSKNYLGDHDSKVGECEPPPIKRNHLLPQTSALIESNLSPKIHDSETAERCYVDSNEDFLKNNTNKMFSYHSITEKPNERCPSPVVPAYANFELAKQMHSNNLDHQPLPDCVADLAFRKLQITGANPGLALDIDPIATGVGIKTHNAGPTHCTKMKVYRPKTSGVVPRALNGNTHRSFSAVPSDKEMSAMDLAICWDYEPSQEPPRPKHIDGSNDSTGPAVFTYVKTPRNGDIINTGHSSGVFANTLGDTSFFDKDVLRLKTDFSGKNDIDLYPTFPKAHSASKDKSVCQRLSETRCSKQYKSTPDMLADQEYKALREKYLGPDSRFSSTPREECCKRDSLIRKARSRLCHKIAPEPNCCPSNFPPKRMTCKTAFRAGVPRYNAAGNFVSSDSACSMGSHHSQKILLVPRPRNPYTKRDYDIDTLVPPFQSYAGGAGEGGYPEHWRLASVYQHAYKPPECRRKPLLQTVYK